MTTNDFIESEGRESARRAREAGYELENVTDEQIRTAFERYWGKRGKYWWNPVSKELVWGHFKRGFRTTP